MSQTPTTPSPPPGTLAILGFFALLTPLAAGGAMGLPLLLSLAGLAAFRPRTITQCVENRPFWLALLGLFLTWASISALWSPWESDAPLKVLPLVGLGLLFAAATNSSASGARLTLAAATATACVLAAMLAIETITELAINRALSPGVEYGEVNRKPARGLVVLMALLWPVVAANISQGAAQKALAAALLVFAAFLSLQFEQASAAVGFAAGAVAFVLTYLAPRLFLLLGSFGLAVWMVAAPFATPLIIALPNLTDTAPLSWAARAAIWRYTCERILEQPWIGHGLEAGRAVTDHVSIRGLDMRGVPIHPHSASLQVWFETGAVGAVLAAVLIAYAGSRAARAFASDRVGAAAIGAMLATLGVMANVGWSLWQEWWTATLLLAVALACTLRLRAARA